MTGATLLLGTIASAASCLFYMNIGGISLKDTFVLPDYAKKEVVHKKNCDVIGQMEYIIQSSKDLSEVQRRVRAAGWADKVLHISLVRRERTAAAKENNPSASSDSGYSRTPWTGMRTVIRDGSGYGTVLTSEGSRDVLIVDRFRQCAGRDLVGYTIYLEQMAP